MKNKPLLSICIPTYNRDTYLERSIKSIIGQKEFHTDYVELIITDNASSDQTASIARQYAQQYANIHYFRNDINILDRNFPTVILNAHGSYRKLMNDTAIWLEGSLKTLLDCIKNNINDKPVLAFSNGFRKNKPYTHCSNMSDFSISISYWTTWIGSFGIWEEDIVRFKDFFYGTEFKLWQVIITYSLLSDNRSSIVINEHLINNFGGVRGGYNIYQIFAVNYFDIILPYFETKKLTRHAYKKLKNDMMNYNFIKWEYEIRKDRKTYQYDIANAKELLLRHYSHLEYLGMRIKKIFMLIRISAIRFSGKAMRFILRRTINKWKKRQDG